MVQLTRITDGLEVQLFGKLEALNPGGSVKDRIGVAMIEAAEAEGRIEPGRTLAGSLSISSTEVVANTLTPAPLTNCTLKSVGPLRSAAGGMVADQSVLSSFAGSPG